MTMMVRLHHKSTLTIAMTSGLKITNAVVYRPSISPTNEDILPFLVSRVERGSSPRKKIMAGIPDSAEETTTITSPSVSSIDQEIDQIKQKYGDNCKIIKNIGSYQYTVKVQLEDYNVSVKFQISEDYPSTRPVVIFTWKHLSNTGYDDGLRSLIQTESTLSSMLRAATDWLHNHTHLLAKEAKDTKKKKDKKKRKPRVKEEEIDQKKPSMKTAIDVISRIQWDSSLEADQFTVGYVDRFLGVVEKNFAILSWDDPAAVDDYEALAIPKHRIEYFKYKDVKVWDKKSRTDNVFGSSGEKKLTILDVIEQYDELAGTKAKLETADTGSRSTDDSDDDFEITLNLTPTMPTTTIDEESDYEDEFDPYWRDKLRPNYFICVQIHEEEIISMVDHIQDTILSRQPLYESCCIKLSALHITLCTIRLNGPQHVQDAVKALNDFKPDFSQYKTKLRLEGMDAFHNRVLYAKVEYDEALLSLVNSIKLALRSSGVELLDGQDFVPHMTIMKTTRPVSRQIGREIPKSVYCGSEQVIFGEQVVDNINLCEMGAPTASDGFYISPLKLQL